ncbi:MAG: LysM peptidoglycan-binding domain-containing protein [Lachnospirales bacterium]
MTIYTVKEGDTIYSIAKNFGVTPEFIINTNFPPNPNNLVVGQDFVILDATKSYTVKNGDTLYKIATEFNVSVNEILRNNPSIIGRDIYEGEIIVISYSDNPTKYIATNGYAYPSIDETTILRALPYLTFLTIFTYGFTNNGDLVYVDDDRLINLANEYGAIPTMHLSTLTNTGVFSSELASLILNDEYAQDNLINNIIYTMEQKGYGALDIDFEYLPVKDKYIEFVKKLTETLNSKGYFSLIALAPKTSTNQSGLLYESHDYYGLGNAVNLALVMTYEWGYT